MELFLQKHVIRSRYVSQQTKTPNAIILLLYLKENTKMSSHKQRSQGFYHKRVLETAVCMHSFLFSLLKKRQNNCF